MMEEELPKTDNLRELEDWFASHPNHSTVFDISAIGFYNWLIKHYPHLIIK